MNKNFLYVIYSLLIAISSCSKHHASPDPQEKFRTVIVYIAANNSLSTEAEANIAQMRKAIGEIDGNLIVYTKRKEGLPAIYEISKQHANEEEVNIKEIKKFFPHNSSSPTVMAHVIDEVQMLYPAKTYGLILWSHATGWVPAEQGNIKLKSFGDDNGSTMDITDLNSALPNNFDFIMFDACSMASVEVLYELRDKAKHFIASPGEVVSNGMPYEKITNDLFKRGVDTYKSVGQKYFDYYNNLSGKNRSATISIIDATKLSQLAIQTKHILESNIAKHIDFNRDHIQRMDFTEEDNPLIAFDFLDFMEQNYETKEISLLISILDETIVFKANTPKFNDIDIFKNSGLTCYIPHIDNEGIAHTFYKSLKWYNDSGFKELF